MTSFVFSLFFDKKIDKKNKAKKVVSSPFPATISE